MVESKVPDFPGRLLAALRAAAADELLALHGKDSLEFGALVSLLDERGRAALVAVWRYCSRWKAEGGPHPEARERVRVRSVEDDVIGLWQLSPGPDRLVTRIKKELPEWEAEPVRYMRGRLVGELEKLRPAKIVGAGAKKSVPRGGPHSLDARALAEAKRLQKLGGDWGPTDVARAIGSDRSSLQGKRGRKPRCPEFSEFWFAVSQQRERERAQRRERGE